MTTRDFAYWLQGLFEIRAADPNSPKGLTAAQVETIENHLKLVFRSSFELDVETFLVFCKCRLPNKFQLTEWKQDFQPNDGMTTLIMTHRIILDVTLLSLGGHQP